MNIFYTADPHLSHINKRGEGALQFNERPFSCIEEHDEKLIENFNSIVGKKDLTYLIGDFAFKNHLKHIHALNGKIILIKGDHDKMNQKMLSHFAEVYSLLNTSVGKQQITLCHWPLKSWKASCHRSWHFYGHSHGRMLENEDSLSCDVGVDAWDFYPVPFEILKLKMESRIENWRKKYSNSSKKELNERTKKLRKQNRVYMGNFLENQLNRNI